MLASIDYLFFIQFEILLVLSFLLKLLNKFFLTSYEILDHLQAFCHSWLSLTWFWQWNGFTTFFVPGWGKSRFSPWYFWHLKSAGGSSLLLVRGRSFSGVCMVSLDNALEGKVLTPPWPLRTRPHWDNKGVFCYWKVRLQVQSALVVHWHHRNGGAHYHLSGRKALASSLDLSHISLVGGCWGTLLLSQEVGTLCSHSTFAGNGGGGATVFSVSFGWIVVVD